MANILHLPPAGAFDPSDITIDDNTSAAFLVQDSSQEFIRVDTTTGARKIDLETGAGNQYLIINEGGGQYVQIRNGASNQFYMTGGDTTRAMIKFFSHDQYGGGYFRIRDAGSAEIMRVDEDSNATFTLDDGSGATFKVTDDGASPKLFFSATEGGNTFLQSDVSTFLDGGGAIYIRVGTGTRIRADGGALYLGGTGKYNIVDAGTPFYNRSTSLVDIGATTGTTVVNIQSDGAYKALKCTPTTTSQTFTLEFQDGSSANGVYAIEQHFAIYNAGTENCTIQATITSGRGSALGKDLSAGGSTSGELVAGMTLNAGKSALFKAVKWNKILTGAATAVDNQFMFQTIMVEA